MTTRQPKIGDPMKYLILIIMFVLGGLAQAEIKASVDRQTLFFGESINLTVVSDQNTNSQPDFTILDAVFHVGQTGRSSSTQIINGEMSTQTSWQVLLVPKSMGEHIIPPIEVDGEKSKPIKITVNKPDPNAKAQGDIFIELETDKSSAYVQEEILLTVRLLYAINLKNGHLSDPRAEGLIVQSINKGANYTTQRDGKTYQVLERKYALFAEQSGPLTLTPLVFEGEVTDNSRRNSFSMFQRGRPIRQVSEMLEMDIKPIPAEFVNQDWIPAKQVTLQQSWSKDLPYEVGKPITRTISLTAAGLLETQLPDLAPTELANAKVYQDKTDTITRVNGDRFIANKTIKYAVIPNHQGKLEIPELTLEWYDTINQQAQVAKIPATTLNIRPAAAGTTTVQPSIDFSPQAIPSTTVTNNEANLTPDSAPGQPHWWQLGTMVFATLWLATLLLFWLKPRQSKPSQEPTAAKTVPSIRGINQATPSEVQNKLIHWWNQQHEPQITNLGQMLAVIEDPAARQALSSLQASLYSGQDQDQSIDWHHLIKSRAFEPRPVQQAATSGLPELYS